MKIVHGIARGLTGIVCFLLDHDWRFDSSDVRARYNIIEVWCHRCKLTPWETK